MMHNEFTQLLKKHNLVQIKKYKRGDVNLHIAEGMREASDHPKSMNVPHWTVMWAVGLDEKMDTANFIRIPAYVKHPLTLSPIETTQATRLIIAEDAAQEWAQANYLAGRY